MIITYQHVIEKYEFAMFFILSLFDKRQNLSENIVSVTIMRCHVFTTPCVVVRCWRAQVHENSFRNWIIQQKLIYTISLAVGSLLCAQQTESFSLRISTNVTRSFQFTTAVRLQRVASRLGSPKLESLSTNGIFTLLAF